MSSYFETYMKLRSQSGDAVAMLAGLGVLIFFVWLTLPNGLSKRFALIADRVYLGCMAVLMVVLTVAAARSVQ